MNKALAIRIAILGVLAALFWLVAYFWVEFAYHGSFDVGVGFYIFLVLIFLIFSLIASGFPWIPNKGYKKHIFTALNGLGLFFLWATIPICIGRLMS